MPPLIQLAMSPSAESLGAQRARIAAAAAGVRFVSENDAPFAPVAVATPAATDAVGVAELRRLFGIAPDVPVRERSLDDFFSYGTAPDPSDAASVADAPRVTALRDLLRTLAPDVRAWRVGDGAEVRYLVVGRVAGGVAGVETTGYES
jgi:hypothetical protein